MSQESNVPTYDVVIVGGALAGASTAVLLLREHPGLRVLIVERSTHFTRRVGEATVEVSAFFLGRVLGLTRHLNHAHLMKQGMRFWFHNPEATSLADCSEIGGRFLSRIPAYQVDRAVLDEEVLRRAGEAGAEIRRPARVLRVGLRSGGFQTVTVQDGETPKEITARWVVDASGVAALLSRQEGWWHVNADHPTTSVWARWQGVVDMDGAELAAKHPEWSRDCDGIRETATNHLMGDGWWAWWIPLKGGDVSIGVVFDQRRVAWPEEGSLGERLKQFLMQHPVARELLAGANWQEGDVHWRKNLPYTSSTFAGDGFVLVGDAAAFIDPFYSPGMDAVAYSVSRAVGLIAAWKRGEALARRIDEHNRDFTNAFDRWFNALYRDKYDYLGDYDLMRLAFQLDVGLYYLGVVRPPFREGATALMHPVFSTPPSVPFYHLMRTYNRRLASMGRDRRRRKTFGRRNASRRFMFPGFTLSPWVARHVVKGLGQWAWLEITEGWRTWFRGVSPRY